MELPLETAVRICPVGYPTSDMVCVHANPHTNTVGVANSHSYPVNYALPVNSCQSTVFATAVAPLLAYLIEGCDVSVVTVGQSGTGKSYTLLGPGFDCASSEAEQGIIPRFTREIFAKMKQYRDRNWAVHVTYTQIIGDNVQDLLGMGSVECPNVSDVFQLVQLGMSNMGNKGAHTLFTLTLEQQWILEGVIQHRVSTASFADLAGNDKVFVYDSNGLMQTIPTDIGLQTLQRCIVALSDSFNSFIPYTQSVLTTLLKDSFGGRAKTLLLCCVSPLLQDLTESLYTLQLAMRAQMIKNFVTVNSYTTTEEKDNCDVFGLQFAANQLLKLVSNAEELFQRLALNEYLPKTEQVLISQWLTLKQECEDCLSENSEPHRSLERIEEEEVEGSSDSESEEPNQNEESNLEQLFEEFKISTNDLVDGVNRSENGVSSRGEFRARGARGRRASLHSVEEFGNLASLNGSKMSEIDEKDEIPSTNLSYETRKKLLKQISTGLELNQQKISDLEKTIRVKENLLKSLLQHKETKSTAYEKLELKCQVLRKECKSVETKIIQAKAYKNQILENKYKNEKIALEGKLKDAENLKSVTADSAKVVELEHDLQLLKKQLEKLKKYKQQKEKYKETYEKQLKEDKSKASGESLEKKTPDRILTIYTSNSSLNDEELECLRHEIRNLRKTRDYLLEMRCKIDVQSQNQKMLNEIEEKKLLQYEEAMDAIDVIMEYKNSILCGHQPLKDLEEQSDRMLMERFLKLNENEMRILLHRYFEKIVDLRCSGKKLEMQIVDVENKHEKLAYYVLNLRHNLQLERSDAERRIASLQQQHEDNLYRVLRKLSGEVSESEKGVSRVVGPRRAALTLQVAEASKNVDRNRLIARFTRYRQETVPRQLGAAGAPPEARVRIEKNKNKLILQKTNRS